MYSNILSINCMSNDLLKTSFNVFLSIIKYNDVFLIIIIIFRTFVRHQCKNKNIKENSLLNNKSLKQKNQNSIKSNKSNFISQP